MSGMVVKITVVERLGFSVIALSIGKFIFLSQFSCECIELCLADVLN